jgi:hypothetical protein
MLFPKPHPILPTPSHPLPACPPACRDANRAMLLAAAASTGALVTDLGIARDTAANVEAALDRAISEGADVLITTGGGIARLPANLPGPVRWLPAAAAGPLPSRNYWTPKWGGCALL